MDVLKGERFPMHARPFISADRRTRFSLRHRLCFTLLWLAGLICAASLPAVAQQQHIEAAVKLIQQGRLTEAEAEARKALNEPSSRPLADAVLGAIRLQQERYEESEVFLKRAVQLNPHLMGAQLNLGNLLATEGKSNEARATFRHVLRVSPENFEAKFALARIESQSGNYRASRDLERSIEPELYHSHEGLTLLAHNDLGLGDRSRVASYITAWLTLPPPPPALSVNFAQELARIDLLSDAVAVLESGRKAEADSFDLEFSLAGYHLKQQNWTQASVDYGRALNLREDCSACLYEMARIEEQHGSLDRSLAYAIRAKQLSPKDPDILFETGRVCLKKDLYIDAIQNLSAALAIRPDRESYMYVLASAYVGKQEYKAAIPLLTSLLNQHPDDPVLNYSLGAVHFLSSDLPDAERYLKRSIQLNPSQVGAYYYLCLVTEAKGDSEEALRMLRPLADRNPEDAATLIALGTLLVRKGSYSEAEPVLKRAVQLDSSSVKVHYQLGLLLKRLGRTDDSNKEFAIVKQLGTEARTESEMQILPPQ